MSDDTESKFICKYSLQKIFLQEKQVFEHVYCMMGMFIDAGKF